MNKPGTGLNSAWLHRFEEVPTAHVRLFCFPHAGGVGQVFREWAEPLAAQAAAELIAITPPGRAQRLAEATVSDMRSAVAEIVRAVRPLLVGLPFAFFGHSLGSLLAFETCLELRRQGLPLPLLLFASAHAAPQRSGAAHMAPGACGVAQLPAAQLLRAVAAWGLVPAAALAQLTAAADAAAAAAEGHAVAAAGATAAAGEEEEEEEEEEARGGGAAAACWTSCCRRCGLT
jgi:surfactin synthase thioesterase subunit